MKNNEETASLCAMNRIFGFEPKIGTALLQHFGCASEVMRDEYGYSGEEVESMAK